MNTQKFTSEKVSNTKLFKEAVELELEFVYETNEAAFFGTEKEGVIYWLIEVFENGEIMIASEDGKVFEKSERLFNLFRLKI
jgi:hypothetical protein